MPEHSLIFGHLLAAKKAIDQLPSRAHPVLGFGHIARQQFPKHGIYYMDLWPIGVPFIMVTNPSMAIQATQTTGIALHRPLELREWFASITGGPAMFDMEPEEWKPWRTWFNPGFSQANLGTLVGHMVEDTCVYRDILSEHARRGDIFQLNNLTLRFTMDLIGRSVL